MQLELKGITKRFPGVVANDSVDLTVAEGELVALLGENGAGKSTLMNVLYGLYSADEGEILIDGEPLTLGSPAESIAAGIGMVHQHFMLVPVFTVAENVILGIEPTNRFGGIKQSAAEQSVRELSQQYGSTSTHPPSSRISRSACSSASRSSRSSPAMPASWCSTNQRLCSRRRRSTTSSRSSAS